MPMRLLGVGLAIAVIVFVVTAGHVVFLPFLILPLGLFGFGQRRSSEHKERGLLDVDDARSRRRDHP